jgi:hypothetical protein
MLDAPFSAVDGAWDSPGNGIGGHTSVVTDSLNQEVET